MSTDLYDRNAYARLGVGLDVPSAGLNKAFVEAQRNAAGRQQEIAAANGELRQLAQRLALDAFLDLPAVPDDVLRLWVGAQGAAEDVVAPGIIQQLMVVPEIDVVLPEARPRTEPPGGALAELAPIEPDWEP